MNMNKYNILVGFLVAMLTIIGCKKKEANIDQALPVGFESFYTKFHEDSIFQIDHIRFPLEGIPSISSQEVIPDFHWDIKDWTMHRPFTDFSDYTREFTVIDSTIVIERIQLKNKEYGMERRFAKTGNEWQLIYYAAMNKLVKNPALQEDSSSHGD